MYPHHGQHRELNEEPHWRRRRRNPSEWSRVNVYPVLCLHFLSSSNGIPVRARLILLKNCSTAFP
jgi:hypothetical protein